MLTAERQPDIAAPMKPAGSVAPSSDDSFTIDLARGSSYSLPPLFIGGKMVDYSPEVLAYDKLGAGLAPHTADGKSVRQLVADVAPDFLSWSCLAAASYDKFDPKNALHAQWRALLDAALTVVKAGGGIAPGFHAHGITAPFVMGGYPRTTTSHPPEVLTNVPPPDNDYSMEQAGKWLERVILPAVGGDVKRIVGVELYNEPATNNPQGYGEMPNRGWYDDPRPSQGTLEEDFGSNITAQYAAHLRSCVPGVRVQGCARTLPLPLALALPLTLH